MTKLRPGFTLVELLVSLAIVGLLASMAFVYLSPARNKARDTKRKADLAQLGRFLSLSCYIPQAGAGDYDLAQIASELIAQNPQYQSFFNNLPEDPKMGSETATYYRYIVNDQNRCALYANLEYVDEPVTLSQLNAPTPGGGQGVLQTPTDGWNGTNKYFQFSN